jgi:hydroxymethylpyrimidine/phosphomethylpyrimidine kinase
MVSTSGHRLLSTEAEEVVKQRLLPMASLITPNMPEMATLANMPIDTFDQKRRAAEHLFGYGVKAILLKGGHAKGDTKSDILFIRSAEGIESTIFTSETIATRNTHGTGCTLSSAIAAYIARGCDMAEAIRRAKEFVTEAIRHGADVSIGHGYGPVNHGFSPQKLYIYDIE